MVQQPLPFTPPVLPPPYPHETLGSDGFPTLVHPPETESHGLTGTFGSGTPETLALEINFRHSGWENSRKRVFDALSRVEPSVWRVNSFQSCGSNAWVEVDPADPGRFRVRCDRCHDRFCLPCGQERARIIAHNVHARLDPRRTRFVTLTLKTLGEPLSVSLDRLYQGFANLRRTKLWERTQTGGVAFLEIKWNPDPGRWHPHLHVLTEGKYIAHAALSKQWLKATGDSFVVHVKAIRNADVAVGYVVKYASKPHHASIFRDRDRLEEAIRALKGRKLCLTYGTWRGTKLSEPPDVGTWQPLAPLVEIICRARNGDDDAKTVLRSLPGHSLPDDCRDPPDEHLTDRIPF